MAKEAERPTAQEEARPDVIAARRHTEDAIDTMAGIMRDTEASGADRLRAANWLLERGWGQASTASGPADEQSYNEIIGSLGPRDPATPTT